MVTPKITPETRSGAHDLLDELHPITILDQRVRVILNGIAIRELHPKPLFRDRFPLWPDDLPSDAVIVLFKVYPRLVESPDVDTVTLEDGPFGEGRVDPLKVRPVSGPPEALLDEPSGEGEAGVPVLEIEAELPGDSEREAVADGGHVKAHRKNYGRQERTCVRLRQGRVNWFRKLETLSSASFGPIRGFRASWTSLSSIGR